MAGALQRCSRWGGKAFYQLNLAGNLDLGCVDLVLQGAQNDTLLTRLSLSAVAVFAPSGPSAGTFTAFRWAVLQGPGDLAPAVQAGIANFLTASVITPFGGISSEGAAPFLLLPSSAQGEVLAEGLFTDQTPINLTWPEDPDAPGAVILRAGKVAQLFVFGGWCTPQQSPNLATTGYVILAVHGGPVRRVTPQSGRGLPQVSLTERG